MAKGEELATDILEIDGKVDTAVECFRRPGQVEPAQVVRRRENKAHVSRMTNIAKDIVGDKIYSATRLLDENTTMKRAHRAATELVVMLEHMFESGWSEEKHRASAHTD